ncbi:transcriptional regulator [Streptomyces sp. 6N223]|uniref:transcriptional regulator n=1 Tax=Streptomyces sp. 6N223 TaxID=3457412 RepID=UPI003FCF2205
MGERADQRRGYSLTIPDALLNSDAMRRACATRNFQEIFRLINRRTGSSHADMAAAIGKMSSARVSDVIRGERRIRGLAVIERIADGFGIPGEMLDLSPRPWESSPENSARSETPTYAGPGHETANVPSNTHLSAQPENVTPGQNYLDAGDLDEMIRREFLRLISITGVLISTAEAQASTEEIQELARTEDIASFGRMNSHIWQVFSLSSSKHAVYPVVREQLNEVVQSLSRAKTQGAHRQLCGSAGDLFQIAGEIFFDSNRYTDAAHCYTLSASASKEASNFDLWACALTRHAFIGMHERKFNEVPPLLDAAAHVARRGDNQMSTRYWVAAVRAEAFARLGDFDACIRALDEAEQVRSLNGTIHNGGWLRFDSSRLAEERGTCYVALGRPDLAETALMDALEQPLSARRRGGVLTDLAVLGIQRRDIDQLLTFAHAAIELAQQTHSGYIKRKIQGLQGQLSPLLSDRRISHLSQEIAMLDSTK